MMPTRISQRVVADRLALIEDLLRDIRSLPLADRESFLADRRNVWAAESCLRRSLEALFDLGRHVLAKGFGAGVSEYKEIATRLHEHGVMSADTANLLRIFAGYRNRLVHFYHEVSADELLDICAHRLGDVEEARDALRNWLRQHPEKLDQSL
jgi:uncharacterized protein YutE (UPF0331/DUF86 family)